MTKHVCEFLCKEVATKGTLTRETSFLLIMGEVMLGYNG